MCPTAPWGRTHTKHKQRLPPVLYPHLLCTQFVILVLCKRNLISETLSFAQDEPAVMVEDILAQFFTPGRPLGQHRPSPREPLWVFIDCAGCSLPGSKELHGLGVRAERRPDERAIQNTNLHKRWGAEVGFRITYSGWGVDSVMLGIISRETAKKAPVSEPGTGLSASTRLSAFIL